MNEIVYSGDVLLTCLFRRVYLSYVPFWILMCCSLDDMEKV
jgi:hypothetical protein